LVEQVCEASVLERGCEIIVAPECGVVLARRSASNRPFDRAGTRITLVAPSSRQACRARQVYALITREGERSSHARGMAVVEELVEQVHEALIVGRIEIGLLRRDCGTVRIAQTSRRLSLVMRRTLLG
jgi:hypothetical protein